MFKYYLFFFLKIILLAFTTNNVIAKIFVSIIILGLLFFISFLYKKHITINLAYLQVNNWPCMIFITMIFSFILMLPFYFRYLRIGKTIDFSIIIYNLKIFLINNTWFTLLITFLFYIIIIISFLYCLLLLRKLFFYHFLCLHLHLITYFSLEDFTKISIYETICYNIISIDSYIIDKILNLISYILYRYKNYGKSYSSEGKLIYHMEFLSTINYYIYQKYISLYLIFIFIIFDLFFNQMILTKIFYILPVIYLFYIFQKMSVIICFFDKAECFLLLEFYTKPISSINKFRVNFKDNTCIEKKELNILNEKLIKAFETDKEEYDYRQDSYWLFKEKKMARLCFLFFNILCNAYLYISCNIRVSFILDIFQFELYSLLLPLLIIQFFLWKSSNKIFKYIFWFISYFIIIITIIIYCNNTLIFCFYETLYNSPFCSIRDFFTLNQKTYFIENYSKSILNKNIWLNENQKDFLQSLIIELINKQKILNDFNLVKIKNFIDTTPDIYLYLDKHYDKLVDIQVTRESILKTIIKKINFWLSIRR